MADSYSIVTPKNQLAVEYETLLEAGRAYFNADRDLRPYVMAVPAQGSRRVMTGTMLVGQYANGEERLVRSLEKIDDPQFLSGYFEALTAAVEERLARVDWSKYTAGQPTFDGHLFDDLDALAKFDAQRSSQLWGQYAPAGTPWPTLDDTALNADSLPLRAKAKETEAAIAQPVEKVAPPAETAKQRLLGAIARQDAALLSALEGTAPDATIAVEALEAARGQLTRLKELVERDAAHQNIRAVFDELREKGLPVDELNADVLHLESSTKESVAQGGAAEGVVEEKQEVEQDMIRFAVPTSGQTASKTKLRSAPPAPNVDVQDSISEARPAGAAAKAEPTGHTPINKSPETLLNGKYVRKENGEYTRANEDRVALVDEDVRIRFVDKQMDTFQAAIELVAVKGWGAIEVAGSEQFRAEAWLNASLAGLEVKGYEPNEKDLAALGAKQSQLRGDDKTNLVDASLRQAEALAKMNYGDVTLPNPDGGRYSGTIKFETPFHVIQDAGRGKAVIHAKKDISNEELKKALDGVPLRVEYQKGGVVFSKAKERNTSKGLER